MTVSFKDRWHAEATTLGLTATVLYIIVVLLVTLFPDQFATYLLVTFSVIGLRLVEQPELTISVFISGLIGSFVTGYAIGAIHALVAHGISQSR